ncbi:mechanosensitive ion channel family protein [Flavobacterium caeni]|uniref:Small conductance mechanosensitive channel n=1 Tax=Flavobacterium caeni TaxID=490189 RepID=A0A1G5F6R5_9FLAO|nr:mechanosensitive ion channel domain-containing protein [Flavobacterium caeni]SCY34949.1 small conductance mechanosensitive channel [Flavobacterium caeni]
MDIDIASFSEIISEKIGHWITGLIRLLPNLVLAAIVMALGLFLAQAVRRFAKRLAGRATDSASLVNLISSTTYFVCIGITCFSVLSILKLDKAVTSILAGAGILGLGLAFAFQDIAANFISGVFMSVRRPLKVGDIVKVSSYMGKIKEINMRDTVVETFQGQTVVIPNKDVFQNPIENYSYLHKRRFDLEVGVSYGEDLEKVKRVTLDAVKDIPGISTHEEVSLFYESFGDSAINFSIRIWIDTAEQATYKEVGSQAIMRIKKAYDENDISIPFPVRTLDFGIKGGKNLRDMLDVAEKPTDR